MLALVTADAEQPCAGLLLAVLASQEGLILLSEPAVLLGVVPEAVLPRLL